MTAETAKTKTKAKASKKDIAAMVLSAGLSQSQVAEQTGICQQRVSQIIQEVKNDKQYQEFTQNKDKVFENLQYKIINLASDDLLKTMLSKRGMTDVAILEDKIRLIRGESTANISYDARVISASVAELRKMVNDNNVIDAES